MHLPTYLTLLSIAEQTLATSYQRVADGHAEDVDVRYTCMHFDHHCTQHAQALDPIIRAYQDRRQPNPTACTHTRSPLPASAPSDCYVIYRISTSLPTWSTSPGPWSVRPPRAHATTPCSTPSPDAGLKPPRSSPGYEPV